jgi:hypothetical protein
MSSPMYDTPEHLPIGVNAAGHGPVLEDDPEYDRTICWCGLDCYWNKALAKARDEGRMDATKHE